MDSSIEVNRKAAPVAKGTEGFGETAEPRVGRGEARLRSARNPGPHANGRDRVSVDPMRGTDRYRLVHPVDL